MDNEINQSKDQVTTTSVRGQPVPANVLEELQTGKEPDHFVRLEIDGKMGNGIYLTNDMKPVSQEDAELLKVVFDDGGVTFYTAG